MAFQSLDVPSLQVAPMKFMIFVCDCILELMNAALSKQKTNSEDKQDLLEQTGAGSDPAQGNKFDKWIDSPRSHHRYTRGITSWEIPCTGLLNCEDCTLGISIDTNIS